MALGTGNKRYREKIQLKFNVSQLDRTILTLINYPTNKKFAGNTLKLFSAFLPESYNDHEKEFRVFMIKKIAAAILDNNFFEKNELLDFISFDGKYENDAVELMNSFYDVEVTQNSMELVDKQISEQLQYGIIGSRVDTLSDLATNYQSENYESLEGFIKEFSGNITEIEKMLRDATESIGASQNDVSLASSSFITSLTNLINEQRNPSTKVKTGIQALNEILDGGYERGRLYIALGVAKGQLSGPYIQ